MIAQGRSGVPVAAVIKRRKRVRKTRIAPRTMKLGDSRSMSALYRDCGSNNVGEGEERQTEEAEVGHGERSRGEGLTKRKEPQKERRRESVTEERGDQGREEAEIWRGNK
eukprot:758625-Hanusia_phi.AAC.9